MAYTNGQPEQGDRKLTLEGSAPESRAAVALKCGPLKIILHVQEPRTCYRAKVQRAVVFAELADPNPSPWIGVTIGTIIVRIVIASEFQCVLLSVSVTRDLG